MPTPSNRTGIPVLPVALLIGVILFLGLAVAPRAFEFDAWPEASRNDATEAMVVRPAEQAVEVPVARVKTRGRGDALAVRGRNPRGRAPAREARPGRRGGSPSRPAGTRRPRGSRGVAPTPPVVVEEAPAPAPVPEPVPEQQAQVAEVPELELVLRPEADAIAPQATPDDFVAARDRRPGARPRPHSEKR